MAFSGFSFGFREAQPGASEAVGRKIEEYVQRVNAVGRVGKKGELTFSGKW